MCAATKTQRKANCFKTSYERAHYYENVQECCPNKEVITKPVAKPSRRPDLYVYDPIVNEKLSTYRKYYTTKALNNKSFESHGKVYLSSKYTLKSLYDEYRIKPVKPFEHNETISGTDYVEPTETIEMKLLQNFYTETSSNKINSSFNEQRDHFFCPYITTSHSVHKHFDKTPMANGKSCVRFDYKNEVKKKIPDVQTFYPVNPRVFFKVPFGGATSIYKGDFKDPATKSNFNNICLNTKPIIKIK
ncbi:PREDICTED: uncharacterized protein LOC105364654 [Ceratosolen solmsi marchali]|uniref:Uncharacterized protein LOC105364654 n=1 Tax=Ceratosolen solmsi marchali TaxID=326594 RepID=A0AAJ7DYC4_9HYME|nr:PREDICTED: uncharacterized protein LOC105364654 [Ceratosolen solmsi marchali]